MYWGMMKDCSKYQYTFRNKLLNVFTKFNYQIFPSNFDGNREAQTENDF